MFDFRSALAKKNGNYDFDELDKILRQIKRENFSEISPEIGVSELLQIARERGWIQEEQDGRFSVKAAKAA